VFAAVFTILLFTVLASVLLAPAIVYSHAKKRSDSWLLPIYHAPAIVVLYSLLAAGCGRPAGLGNLVEFLILAAIAVPAGYLKIFLIDPMVGRPKVTTYILTGLLAASAVPVRLLMPTMSE
jgi:hypothetical protein